MLADTEYKQLTLRQVIEAKKGAPVYSLHPPIVATFPDAPLDNSPVHQPQSAMLFNRMADSKTGINNLRPYWRAVVLLQVKTCPVLLVRIWPLY